MKLSKIVNKLEVLLTPEELATIYSIEEQLKAIKKYSTKQHLQSYLVTVRETLVYILDHTKSKEKVEIEKLFSFIK